MCVTGAIALVGALAGAYGSKRSGEQAKRAAANVPPPVDTAAQQAAVRRRALLAKGAAAGGFGTPATFTGAGSMASGGKGGKTLLGQ